MMVANDNPEYDVNLSPSGSYVAVPSFYRPGLEQYVQTLVGASSPGEFANNLNFAQLWNLISLRPNPRLHPNFALSNLRLNPDFNNPSQWQGQTATHDPYYRRRVDDEGGFVPPPWDVDNTGDGLADSVWIDPGLPVQTAPDGRR